MRCLLLHRRSAGGGTGTCVSSRCRCGRGGAPDCACGVSIFGARGHMLEHHLQMKCVRARVIEISERVFP